MITIRHLTQTFFLTLILAVSVAAGDTNNPPRPDEGEPGQSSTALPVPVGDEANTAASGSEWQTVIEALRLLITVSSVTLP